MIKQVLKSTAIAGLLLLTTQGVMASEGAGMRSANANLNDKASLQRGAALYMNYCSGCHSLEYLRYSRLAEDLQLSEEEVMQNLNFTGAKFQEPIVSAMPAADAEKWFGKAPPDLSLEVRAKGADWVYSYLHGFYLDPTRPVGWNNTVFANASMPNVLAPLQGVQEAVFVNDDPASGQVEKLKLTSPGSMTPAQFDQAARDITNFLQYAAEPAALKRTSMGAWVLLYLGLFTLLAYLLKKEFWKDVH